jgi:hypothetical protein
MSKGIPKKAASLKDAPVIEDLKAVKVINELTTIDPDVIRGRVMCGVSAIHKAISKTNLLPETVRTKLANKIAGDVLVAPAVELARYRNIIARVNGDMEDPVLQELIDISYEIGCSVVDGANQKRAAGKTDEHEVVYKAPLGDRMMPVLKEMYERVRPTLSEEEIEDMHKLAVQQDVLFKEFQLRFKSQ